MILLLLTRILLWVAVGLIIWYILLRFIPRTYLTWLGGFVVLGLLVASFIDTGAAVSKKQTEFELLGH